MGGRKTPGSEDLSPFTRTSPGEPTGSDVIAENKRGGGGGGQREYGCCSCIPEGDSSPLFALLHSSTAAAPFRAGLEKDALDSFL